MCARWATMSRAARRIAWTSSRRLHEQNDWRGRVAHGMTKPHTHLVWMAIGLVAVLALAWLLAEPIYTAFLHNPALNSGIFVVLLIGMAYIFWQVLRLFPEIDWIERLKRNELGTSNDPTPRLLAPMAAMVRERT